MSKYPDLDALYGPATVEASIMLAIGQAKAFPESYVGDGFEPHKWVVAAVASAMHLGGRIYMYGQALKAEENDVSG